MDILTVENKHFAPAMARAKSVIGTASTVPILGCVLLHTSGPELVVEATNMVLTVRERIAIPPCPDFSAALDADILSALAQRLPKEATLTLERSDKNVVLKSGRARVSVPSLPPEDFSAFDTGKMLTEFVMPGPLLASALERTLPFVSTDLLRRAFISGVAFAPVVRDGKETLRIAATNGYQLMCVYHPAPQGTYGMFPISLPAKAAAEIRKSLTDLNIEVVISSSETKAIFTIGGITYISKLIDGEFPDVERNIPTQYGNLLRIGKAELARTLGLVTTVCQGGKEAVVKLDLSRGSVVVTGFDDPRQKEKTATDELPPALAEYDGEDLSIGLQAKYLTMPAQLVSDVIEFRFGGAEQPILAQDASDLSGFYVALPYRI
jgi:DNA polymerase III subunit beta